MRSDENHCPFCGNPNECGVGAIVDCWCGKTVIPRELIELLPVQAKSCICVHCVDAYKQNPADFVRINQTTPP